MLAQLGERPILARRPARWVGAGCSADNGKHRSDGFGQDLRHRGHDVILADAAAALLEFPDRYGALRRVGLLFEHVFA
jgi:hypothetical protein